MFVKEKFIIFLYEIYLLLFVVVFYFVDIVHTVKKLILIKTNCLLATARAPSFRC